MALRIFARIQTLNIHPTFSEVSIIPIKTDDSDPEVVDSAFNQAMTTGSVKVQIPGVVAPDGAFKPGTVFEIVFGDNIVADPTVQPVDDSVSANP